MGGVSASGAGAGGVVVHVDGRALPATDGQTLLGALIAEGYRVLRDNPVTGEPRGGYCGMGVCFECEVEVDGRPQVRACMELVRDGQRVHLAASAPTTTSAPAGSDGAGPRGAASDGAGR